MTLFHSIGSRGLGSARCVSAVAMLAVASATGCASIGAQPGNPQEIADDTNDPLEGLNRQIFAANLAIDTFILRPAAVAYRELMPQPGKYVLRNFVDNIKLPFTALNDLAQGNTDRAGTAIGRFVVNTTLGIGGIFDPATDLGLPYHREDFGQTLASWGVEEGPYLVLPIFGPSNFRDAVGSAVGVVGDPVKLAAAATDLDTELLIGQGVDSVDARYRSLGQIDGIRERSLDFYATARSLYRQRRELEIRNGDIDTTIGETVLSKAEPRAMPPAEPPTEPIVAAVPIRQEPADAGLAAEARDTRADVAAFAAEPEPTSVATLPADAPRAESTMEFEPFYDERTSYRRAVRSFEEASRAYEDALKSIKKP